MLVFLFQENLILVDLHSIYTIHIIVILLFFQTNLCSLWVHWMNLFNFHYNIHYNHHNNIHHTILFNCHNFRNNNILEKHHNGYKHFFCIHRIVSNYLIHFNHLHKTILFYNYCIDLPYIVILIILILFKLYLIF